MQDLPIDNVPASMASGRVRSSAVMEDGTVVPISDWLSNLVTYNWGHIVGHLLSGHGEYRIGAMYLEYENTANPGDVVAVPTLDRTRDVDYYNGLASVANKDYLRVSLTARTLFNSDPAVFTKENGVNFFARTSGVVGVHGKPFSHADNSVIIGGSLVATPVADDATRDVLLSSFYFPPAEQVPKTATVQFGLDWELVFS